MRASALALLSLLGVVAAGCADRPEPVDPDTAPRAMIDRFSPAAGTLLVRDADNGLPGPDEPIDLDRAPFITRGLGPAGERVRYYHFDVQDVQPAPIHVFVRARDGAPVEGQLDVVDVIPGDPGYTDFWQVVRVLVDDAYVANEITSVDEIVARRLPREVTPTLVNRPIVPVGSTARLRHGGGDTALTRGWYRGHVVHTFHFAEAPLETLPSGFVPSSPIYVTFNVNPGEPGGGPPSGFVTEPGTDQTHNVVGTLPGQRGYSPMWAVNIYDNVDFDDVVDLPSAEAATILARYVTTVNCPIAAIDEP